MNEMFKIAREEILWGGRKLMLETGKIARQADGAVVATYGETVVLCTVVMNKKPQEGIDFLPLSVHYQEKTFAAGRIPGGFFKREAKPSERETLISRLIDRPIRPLFPDNLHNEIQVLCTVLSYDPENDPNIVAAVGASAALAISGIPFHGPIGAAKVGYINGSFTLNPSYQQLLESDLELIVAGTEDGVLMVESEAKELSEQVMLEAVNFGHSNYQPIIKLIKSLQAKVGKEPIFVPIVEATHNEPFNTIKNLATKDLIKAYETPQKQQRCTIINEIKNKVIESLASEFTEILIESNFKKLQSDILRTNILSHSKRLDGRSLEEVRQIICEIGVLPRVHGSALFTRGETQALVVTTLGTGHDEQFIDGLEGERKENFMLHYNFPPYSVGETGRMAGPGRREIGHGKLAWRAVHPILPIKSDFPYTIRVVSEVTESNGSSSMATVCGASLSLMDAAVPLPRPIAGIAMGLIKKNKEFAVLSDISGDEDHLGDMDFKVAGTQQGITALQMDIKITSITPEIMQVALSQAKEGRFHILQEMKKALDKPKESMSAYAPRIVRLKIPKDKIRDVIGSGGKVIREICETTGVKIDIDDDGNVAISSANQSSLEQATTIINDIVLEPKIGLVYNGKVIKVLEFGAIVGFSGSRDGMVHISEISESRIEKVSDVLKVGDEVKVKLIGIDGNRFKLSIKKV